MGLFESIINCLHELLIIIRIEGKKTRSNFFKKVGFTNSLNARAELGLLPAQPNRPNETVSKLCE